VVVELWPVGVRILVGSPRRRALVGAGQVLFLLFDGIRRRNKIDGVGARRKRTQIRELVQGLIEVIDAPSRRLGELELCLDPDFFVAIILLRGAAGILQLLLVLRFGLLILLVGFPVIRLSVVLRRLRGGLGLAAIIAGAAGPRCAMRGRWCSARPATAPTRVT
jgi:hypothetical protein